MRHVQIGETGLLECERCDAVWLEAAVFERLCADREAQAAVLHRFGGRPAGPIGPVRYRKCVRCGKMMNRVNFGKASGTVVDVCRGHGTFLDAGELHAIVTFIEGGGLERARERQIADLKEQEQRLRELELRAMRDRGTADLRRTSSFHTTWDGGSISKLLDVLGRKAR
jgi:Zn-finger nucleic acid-binding protein